MMQMKKAKTLEPLARKVRWQRKVRHQSGVEKLKVLPEVKEGRPLDAAGDDRPWMASI